jgi:hypothetical protein
MTRGPAKGYVEALEHRLQVTEGLLLKLLSHISDPVLSSISPEDSLSSNGPGYAPLARLEKKGIEEWSQFPLDTAQGIRKWQRVCTGQEGDGLDNQSVGSPAEVLRGVKRKNMDDYEQEQSSSPVTYEQRSIRKGFSGPGHRTTFAEIGSETPGHSNHGVGGSDNAQNVSATQTRSSWDGAPSISFQQQFLW